MDMEISEGRKIALRRLYQNRVSLDEVEEGFVEFSTAIGRFKGYNVIRDMWLKKPSSWWATLGATCTILQQLAMRLLSEVTSISCSRGIFNIQ
jgi:hypothetical protein